MKSPERPAGRIACAAAALASCLLGCDVADSPQAAARPAGKDSHVRMVESLARIGRLSKTDDPFFQDATVARYEAELAALPPQGREADRFQLHAFLADDYRRLGRPEKAVEHMRAAEALGVDGGLIADDAGKAYFLFEIGLTYLRLAETENCVYCRTGESCILPIRGGGLHRKQEGSRKAVEYFERVLRLDPSHLPAKWLLNVAAMTLGSYPDGVPETVRVPPEAFASTAEFPRFSDVADAVGLKVVGCGGGAVADDFDGDGRLDLLVSSWAPDDQIRYFRNAGDGTFDDRTKESGLTGIVGGINMVQGDYDGDGRVDVFVTRGAWLAEAGMQPNSLLKNLGGGKFRDVTYDVGLAADRFPTPTAAWGDYDGDGDLDLYVGNEGPPSRLFRNDAGKFTDVTGSAGVANDRFTKAAVWGDYDGDRRPDLYLSNLQGENRLYHNDGDGRFTDVAPRLGVTEPAKGFPAWFWDVNNDGALDLFASSYNTGVEHVAADFFGRPRTDEPDRLYLGDGKGGFREAAEEFGLTRRATQPMGSNFGDLDNDGYPDFSLGTGYPGFEGLMPNLMFHNRGGTGFDDVTFAGGFGHLQKGHGTAFADFDDDGDQDVFVKMGGAYPADAFGSVLFENPGFGNRSVRVKLVGVRSNRSAIGARIKAEIVDGGERRTVYKWVDSGGSFGANPLEQQIGVGKAGEIESLEIFWPTTGETQRFEHVPVGGRIVIREGGRDYERFDLKPAPFRKARAAEQAVTPTRPSPPPA